MPLYMDVHTIEGGVSADDVANAHKADLQTQGGHDVNYLRYWVNEPEARCSASSRRQPPEPLPRCTARHMASWPTTSSKSRKVHDDSPSRTTGRARGHVHHGSPPAPRRDRKCGTVGA